MSDDPTPQIPRPVVRGAVRERGFLLSLLRLLGLAAIVSSARRSLFRTRARSNLTIGTTGGLVAALTAVGLFLPNTGPGRIVRDTAGAVIHVPGDVIPGIGSGTSQEDVTKAYPRLYSNRLGVDVAIKPGDGGQHPPVVPIAFQYPNTAPVGKPGNTYLYAHDRAGMFLGLHNAHIGDVLIVAETPTQKLYFQITEIHANVAWNDLQWLQPSQDVRLTLQTCNFSGDFDPRFIVITKQIPEQMGMTLTNNA